MEKCTVLLFKGVSWMNMRAGMGVLILKVFSVYLKHKQNFNGQSRNTYRKGCDDCGVF